MVNYSSHYTTMKYEDTEKDFKDKLKSGEIKLVELGYYLDMEEIADNRGYDVVSISVTEKNHRSLARMSFVNDYDLDYIDVRVKRTRVADVYLYKGQKHDEEDIMDSIRSEYFKLGLDEFYNLHKGKQCMIRTDGGYWRESCSGYTNMSGAGTFPIEKGYNKVQGLGIDKDAELIIV